MAYNKANDVTAGYISAYHKELLKKLAAKHSRKLRAEQELIIEQAALKEGVK